MKIIITVFSLVLLVGSQGAQIPEAQDLTSLIVAVGTKGLRGLTESVEHSKIQCAEIPSVESLLKIDDLREREIGILKRDFGRRFLMAIETNCTDTVQIEDLTLLRYWVTSQSGYGNLVLSSALDRAMIKKVLRSIASGTVNSNMVENVLKTTTAYGTDRAFWTKVAERNWPELVNGVNNPAGNPEYLQMAQLLNALRKNSSTDSAEGKLLESATSLFAYCYDVADPRYLALVYGETMLNVIALEVISEIHFNAGQVPHERADFVIAAKLYATRILRKKERFGGRMDPQSIWRVWNESLKDL